MPPKKRKFAVDGGGAPWPIGDLNTVVDIHKYVPKPFQVPETHYDRENELKLKIPNNSLFCGQTQSGKTKTAIDLLVKMDCFDFIIICVKDPTEQLYQLLIDLLNKYAEKHHIPTSEVYQICGSFDELPSVDSLDASKNTLCLIDDMITEKECKLKKAAEYTVRGLKKKLSTWFFTQSYFKAPKLLRDNVQYVFLFKVVSDSDMENILRTIPTKVPHEVLSGAFEQAFLNGNFITIDTRAVGPGKFRLNYSEPLFSSVPESEEESPKHVKRRARTLQ